MSLKQYTVYSVLEAARERVSWAFDTFPKLYLSFSGGKDSTVMMHLVCQEARKRGREVGVLIVDLEAQYEATIRHMEAITDEYADVIDLHWFAGPMSLRNGVSNFEPRWVAWEEGREEVWVRPKPKCAKDHNSPGYEWYEPGMEFEEFVVEWGEWYAGGELTGAFVGIRADESLNRFRTIAVFDKKMIEGKRWTTHVTDQVYNLYPIYDWRTEDIWRFHGKYPELSHNRVYDLMNKAGVPLSHQRLCQPYGDDQRQGLWLYHIIEPHTWFKLISRVNGVNSGAFYVQERGNINGYGAVSKPEGHTWRSFVNLLLRTMPAPTREHYLRSFRTFIKGWLGRGYTEIPDEAPRVLEDQMWAPSWRRMAKVLLRNDYWCKGLGLTQPKSEAYGKYLAVKKMRNRAKEAGVSAEEARRVYSIDAVLEDEGIEAAQ